MTEWLNVDRGKTGCKHRDYGPENKEAQPGVRFPLAVEPIDIPKLWPHPMRWRRAQGCLLPKTPKLRLGEPVQSRPHTGSPSFSRARGVAVAKRGDYGKENLAKHQKQRKTRSATAKGVPSERHMRVIDEYFHHTCNKIKYKALMRAGYSRSTAMTNADDIFGRPEVIKEIKRREDEMAEKYKLSPEWVIQRQMMLANVNRGEAIQRLRQNKWDISVLTEEEKYALGKFIEEEYTEGRGETSREVKRTKVEFHDVNASLKDLARLGGFNKDKMEVEGSIDVVDVLSAGRKRVAAATAAKKALAEKAK